MATLIYLMMTLLTLIILRTNDISMVLKVALGSIYATLLGPGTFLPEKLTSPAIPLGE